MTSHLTLAWKWVDCADPETCQEHVHLEEAPETLNSYPVEWLEALLGNCRIRNNHIFYVNTFGQKHNETGPAAIWVDGSKEWHIDGELHRDDGPAIEDAGGTRKWYQHGNLHRENGPAIIFGNGDEEWHLNGQRHRVDGPAVICKDGDKEWYLHGKRHRSDGPAVEHGELQEWWLNGAREWWLDDYQTVETITPNYKTYTTRTVSALKKFTKNLFTAAPFDILKK